MKRILLNIIFLFLTGNVWGTDCPVSFTDSGGAEITLEKQPQRVVSLVPSVTEILMRIGAGDSVVGITYHSVLPPETAGKEIVGGFFNPNLDRVAALQPDLIFYADLQKNVPARFSDTAVLVQLSPAPLMMVSAISGGWDACFTGKRRRLRSLPKKSGNWH